LAHQGGRDDGLGLPHADIDVIRTGGPAATDDVLAEIIVSNRVLGSTEIMLLNHTGCGFTTFTDEEMNTKLAAETGVSSPAPMRFFAYKDPVQHTREPSADANYFLKDDVLREENGDAI
jgi:carbonic anhydrase